MSKFAFVILHYNTLEDTFDCVNSIKNFCATAKFHIYVVDNASPNLSGSKLELKYKSDEFVTVILSKNNLGFAKGNNLGIERARQDGFNDFIVVTNSDTKIIQKDFCEKIEKYYASSSFAVLGPTIYTPKGETFINPFGNHIVCGRELIRIQKYYRMCIRLIELDFSHLYFLYVKLNEIKNRFIQKVWRVINRIPKGHFYTENCVLHGCCLVFSNLFFEKFNGFDPRTFLYVEEQILHTHIVMSGLKTIYAPEVKIWHKEDGATDSVYKNSKEKKLFQLKNILKSIDVYQEILHEYGLK